MDVPVKKRSSGKRTKKRKFQGNKFLKKSAVGVKGRIDFVSRVPNEDCASSKKLPSARKIIDNYTDSISSEFGGYRLIDLTLFFSKLEKLVCCRKCHGTIKLREKSTIGLSSTFLLLCDGCEGQDKINSCELIGEKKNIPDINRRSVLAMRYLGQGLSGLQTFCSVMCLPKPITQKAYDSINVRIADAGEKIANASMVEASASEKILKKSSKSISVSGDGTWKTRGHSSLVGVCTVVGAESGKAIDVEVMSSFCKGCSSYKGPKFGPKYSSFMARHKGLCTKNHSGSAALMEVKGMLRIFERSEKKHDRIYTEYIGDGDSKTYPAIVERKPYGPDVKIEKLECVGHVQKRMGSRLRKLKSALGRKQLSDGRTIGGRGRLTDDLIKKLTLYYGNAIRGNPNSAQDMRQAVWATWAHYSSTDDKPMHWFCPTGSNSWCKYNIAQLNKTPFQHVNSIPKAVSEAIKPVYKDLSHLKLLRKCLGGKTQNPNESLNALIWKFSPKLIGSGFTVTKIASYMAVCEFNDGKKSHMDMMSALGLKFNKEMVGNCIKADKERKTTGIKRASAASLEARKAKKLKSAIASEKQRETEGSVYDPGAF